LGGPGAKRGNWILLEEKKIKKILDIHNEGAHIKTRVKTDPGKQEKGGRGHINTNS
jgi:hypothetical protein